MNDKKTPIPLRASRKQAEPQPLTFPQPNRHINVISPATDVIDLRLQDVIDAVVASTQLRNHIADCIHQAITKALYAIGNYGDGAEPIIAEMTYDEFESFMARVWEDE